MVRGGLGRGEGRLDLRAIRVIGCYWLSLLFFKTIYIYILFVLVLLLSFVCLLQPQKRSKRTFWANMFLFFSNRQQDLTRFLRKSKFYLHLAGFFEPMVAVHPK